MVVRSEITELRRVLYDSFIEDNPTNNDKSVHDNQFDYVQNGITVCCKTQLAKGLHIAEVNLDTCCSLTNTWSTEKPHVRFFFYLKGNSHVNNGAGNESYSHRIGMLQRNFLDTQGGGGEIVIEKNDQVHYIIIKMTYSFYLELLKDEEWIENDPFHQYILRGRPENRPNETLFMDLGILKILQEIMNNESVVHHRYHYLKLKLKELLFVIYQKTNTGEVVPEKGSNSNNRLEEIRSYLVQNLENPPSSADLAKRFMLNERKLKADFQKKFGKTIYGLVIQMRMEKAIQLLYENLNVNEIACILGYSSVPHFIKVFRTYYGDTPKQFMLDIHNKSTTIPQSKLLCNHIQ